MARSVKWILRAVLAVAVTVSGVECLGMRTPERAMQCCDTMRCHSHSHHRHQSQDCCNTVAQMHAVLGQPSSVLELSFAPIPLGLAHAFRDSQMIEFSPRITAERSHDPPSQLSGTVLSLRI
jgi:hypothetical protein